MDMGEAPFLVYTNTTTETLDHTPDPTTHVTDGRKPIGRPV
jgi:hypothetical protein